MNGVVQICRGAVSSTVSRCAYSSLTAAWLSSRPIKVDYGDAAVRSQSDVMLANVLASVAIYENEFRSERIRAGRECRGAAAKSMGGLK